MRYPRPVLALAAFVCLSSPLYPVVYFGDGNGNNTPPADDFGLANVGARSNSTSGVYLGNFGGEYWVLTARHSGAGAITLNGNTYNAVSGSATYLSNSGLTSGTPDLVLYRIDGNPGLPNLAISRSTPTGTVALAGYGLQQESSITYWQVTGTSSLTWTERSNSSNSNLSGYKLLGSRGLHYGYNLVSGTQETSASGYTSLTFSTYFSDVDDPDDPFDSADPTAIASEAQVVVGDSGGGVFYKNGEDWELAGIIITTNLYNNQPSAAVFGTSSFFVDLSKYRDQIVAVVPEPRHIAGIVALAALAVSARRRRLV